MTPKDAEDLQQRFAEWAGRVPSWRALAVVGSWARGAARAESDLDLMALVDDLGRWTADAEWLGELLSGLGREIETLSVECHGVARSWRVTLGSGVELDLCLADTGWACTQPLDPGTQRVVEDGMRPLVDKDGLLVALIEEVARGDC